MTVVHGREGLAVSESKRITGVVVQYLNIVPRKHHGVPQTVRDTSELEARHLRGELPKARKLFRDEVRSADRLMDELAAAGFVMSGTNAESPPSGATSKLSRLYVRYARRSEAPALTLHHSFLPWLRQTTHRVWTSASSWVHDYGDGRVELWIVLMMKNPPIRIPARAKSVLDASPSLVATSASV